jgi:hypothetical protein
MSSPPSLFKYELFVLCSAPVVFTSICTAALYCISASISKVPGKEAINPQINLFSKFNQCATIPQHNSSFNIDIDRISLQPGTLAEKNYLKVLIIAISAVTTICEIVLWLPSLICNVLLEIATHVIIRYKKLNLVGFASLSLIGLALVSMCRYMSIKVFESLWCLKLMKDCDTNLNADMIYGITGSDSGKLLVYSVMGVIAATTIIKVLLLIKLFSQSMKQISASSIK